MFESCRAHRHRFLRLLLPFVSVTGAGYASAAGPVRYASPQVIEVGGPPV